MTQYEVRDLGALADQALAALQEGGSPGFPLIDGRILSVQATPDRGTSADMAFGIAALPAGFSVPPHSHRAEEFATVLRGSGVITIEDEAIEVEEGSVVVTPPNLVHTTSAGPDGPLVVYWVYGPAGSEQRWLEAESATEQGAS